MVEQNCPLGWSTVYYWNGAISWIINSSRSVTGGDILKSEIHCFVCFLGFWIPSFRSENSTSEARKGIKGEQCVGSLCLQTYLVHRVVHFVLQDGLCDGGTEGRRHIFVFSSVRQSRECTVSFERKWRKHRKKKKQKTDSATSDLTYRRHTNAYISCHTRMTWEKKEEKKKKKKHNQTCCISV